MQLIPVCWQVKAAIGEHEAAAEWREKALEKSESLKLTLMIEETELEEQEQAELAEEQRERTANEQAESIHFPSSDLESHK